MKRIGKILWSGVVSETCGSRPSRIYVENPNTAEWCAEFAMMMARAEGCEEATERLEAGTAVIELRQEGPYQVRVYIHELLD